MPIAPGTRLGPFEVTALIGAGGMGEIYRARDTRLDRTVAIKILPPELAADPDRRARFEREARAISHLSHPHICTLFDVGREGGTDFLVMEYLEGETLAARLARAGVRTPVSGVPTPATPTPSGAPAGERGRTRAGRPLPFDDTLRIGAELAEALAAAHKTGIIHRDLKPGNVMLTPGGVKVLDFGLAKLRVAETAAGAGSASTRLAEPVTDAGTRLGTIPYMAPEQVEGKDTDARSDLFALGAILYEMATGRRAFEGETAASVAAAILDREPEPVTALQPLTPPAFEHVVATCLAKDPEARWQAAGDVARELRWIAKSGTGSTPPIAADRPRTSKRFVARAIIGTALAAALVAAGFLLARRRTERQPESPSFTRLTFQRGRIENARFASDGKSVFYGAAWDGRPPDVFETRTDRSITRSLGLPGTRLHAVSRSGELAVEKGATSGLHEYGSAHGPLAIFSLSGGAPRDLVEDVSAADWAPDGSTLAVVRRIASEDRLEMPPGHVLVRTSGWLRDIRVSPDGRRVAFIEHPLFHDSRGRVAVADATGRRMVLTQEYGNVVGVAWSPDGREIWFSAAAVGMRQCLFAVTLEGRLRTVARFPTSAIVQDVARDGRVLLVSTRDQTGIRGSFSADNKERELGWLENPWPAAFSADGRMLLLEDAGETAGAHYSIYLKPMDGSEPTKLGTGAGCALSPDGRWALAVHHGPPQRLELIPTGPGDVLFLPSGQVETYQYAGSFLPDGRRIVFIGAERGRPQRTWIQEPPGGTPHPVTPEGTAGATTSPDGRWVAALDQSLRLTLFPLQGGEPRTVATLAPEQEVVQWSADGRTLFVSQLYRGPRLDVFGIDVESGRRRLWKTFEVPDPAGVGVATFIITRDARSYAYVYERILDELYLVEGLK